MDMNGFCNHCFDLYAIDRLATHRAFTSSIVSGTHSTMSLRSIFIAFSPFSSIWTGRASFNPRIEYNNEWRPVGHSDPLKNDPTFDYSPPVLDRVRYWSDHGTATAQTNGMKEKKEILLLGVPSRHTVHSHPNQVPQTEPKTSNRRMFYAPQVSWGFWILEFFGLHLYITFQPSRMLTPPPMQHMMQMGFQSDFGSMNAAAMSPSMSYWNQEPSIPLDAYGSESASFVTVLKPKSSPNPYLATAPSVYKDARQSIYNFAANVNALQASDKKRPWLQNLLQKEVTYHTPTVMPTTPQIVMSYSPPVFESHSTLTNDLPTQYQFNPFDSTTLSPVTTVAPITLTTDELFSHYKQPTEPLHGPMYLIIQGHSKVKTYGGQQTVNGTIRHSAKMVPVETSRDPVVTHVVSEEEDGNVMKVAHMHKTSQNNDAKHQTSIDRKKTNSTVDSLLSLLDSSFMGFFMNDEPTKLSATKKTTKLTENKNVKHEARHTTKMGTTKKSTTTRMTTAPPTSSTSQLTTTSSTRDIS